jgi:hypothetical protein
VLQKQVGDVSFKWLLIGLSTLLLVSGVVASVLMHGANPFLHPEPRMVLSPLAREVWSAVAGLSFGLVVILFTRHAVDRLAWARRLHQDLRPIAQQLSPWMILLLAALSSIGEELLFRSFLTPWVGVVPQAILFGLLHQIPGPSRWVWVVWATLAGLVFGAMYETLGSLTGPILAHGLINALNLQFLRSHEPLCLGPARQKARGKG